MNRMMYQELNRRNQTKTFQHTFPLNPPSTTKAINVKPHPLLISIPRVAKYSNVFQVYPWINTETSRYSNSELATGPPISRQCLIFVVKG